VGAVCFAAIECLLLITFNVAVKAVVANRMLLVFVSKRCGKLLLMIDSIEAQRVVLALDSRDFVREHRILREIGESVGIIKIAQKRVKPHEGAKAATWSSAYRAACELAPHVQKLLDFKISDVPENTEDIVADLTQTGAAMISVHSLATSGSVRAAVAARGRAKIVAHTIDSRETEAGCQRLLGCSIPEAVLRLGRIAAEDGVDTLFVPSYAVERVRADADLGALTIIATGIAVPSFPQYNHHGALSPRQTVDAGADYFVVGRAFTDEANDPTRVLEQIVDNLR
jgi:orotidine-5'-phosphate decarboxylase